jgi:hypothetical protein
MADVGDVQSGVGTGFLKMRRGAATGDIFEGQKAGFLACFEDTSPIEEEALATNELEASRTPQPLAGLSCIKRR